MQMNNRYIYNYPPVFFRFKLASLRRTPSGARVEKTSLKMMNCSEDSKELLQRRVSALQGFGSDRNCFHIPVETKYGGHWPVAERMALLMVTFQTTCMNEKFTSTNLLGC